MHRAYIYRMSPLLCVAFGSDPFRHRLGAAMDPAEAMRVRLESVKVILSAAVGTVGAAYHSKVQSATLCELVALSLKKAGGNLDPELRSKWISEIASFQWHVDADLLAVLGAISAETRKPQVKTIEYQNYSAILSYFTEYEWVKLVGPDKTCIAPMIFCRLYELNYRVGGEHCNKWLAMTIAVLELGNGSAELATCELAQRKIKFKDDYKRFIRTRCKPADGAMMWKNLPTDADDAKQQFPSQWGLKFGGMDFVVSKLHPMAVQRLDMKISCRGGANPILGATISPVRSPDSMASLADVLAQQQREFITSQRQLMIQMCAGQRPMALDDIQGHGLRRSAGVESVLSSSPRCSLANPPSQESMLGRERLALEDSARRGAADEEANSAACGPETGGEYDDTDFEASVGAMRVRDARKSTDATMRKHVRSLRDAGDDNDDGPVAKGRPVAKSKAKGPMKRPAAATVSPSSPKPTVGGKVRLEITRKQYVATRKAPNAEGKENKVFKFQTKSSMATASAAATKWLKT